MNALHTSMKILLLGSSLIAAGCSGQDAIVGDSEPITCGGGPDGEIIGVLDDGSGATLEITVTEVSPGASNSGRSVTLTGAEGSLLLDFFCAPVTAGTYDVASFDLDACPTRANAYVYLDAWDATADAVVGTAWIDDTNGCMAGGFDLDVNNSDGLSFGQVSGWFRSPDA